MNEGINYDCKDKEDAVKAIIEEYHRYDVCMGEILHSLELQGFSIQDVVDIYAKVMHKIEGDKLMQIVEDTEVVCRWRWERDQSSM